MKSQSRIVVSVDVLAAIVENCLNQEASRTRCHRFFSVTLHETVSLQYAFPGSDYTSEQGNNCSQLNLFAC
jgi:hypothetical protein